MGVESMRRMRCRRLLILLCAALAICLRRGSAYAEIIQPSVAESGSVIVTAATAEVREGPAADFNVITVVEKGEIFLKQGRTGAWYYILINGDAYGWISGRAIGSYQAEASPSPSVIPYDDRYDYPYYPGGYYGYFWGQPFLTWDWYVYGHAPPLDRPRERERDYNRDRYRDRSRDDLGRPDPNVPRPDLWRGDGERSQGGGISGDGGRPGGVNSHRGGDNVRRPVPEHRPSTPRFRGPFQRR